MCPLYDIGGFHPVLGVDSSAPVLVHRANPILLKSRLLINGSQWVLLIVMSLWCIDNGARLLAHL
jgi:hypothetical protein